MVDADIPAVAALLELLARKHITHEFKGKARALAFVTTLRNRTVGSRVSSASEITSTSIIYSSRMTPSARGSLGGFGALLLPNAFPRGNPGRFTVNSSNNAVAFYEKLGFARTAPMQDTDGVFYNPMATHVGA